MSSLQATLADTAKINRLFERLAETTPGAVKTRTALLGQLKIEMKAHAELERTQLLPALRKHPETRELARAAADRLSAVRDLLALVEREPVEGEAFCGKIKDLKKLFQAHLRDDKSDLLPAVKKVLTADEAASVAERIAAAKIAADRSEKEAAEAHRAEARKIRDEAEAREAAVIAAKRAEEKAAAGARHLAASAAEAARIASENTREAMTSGVRAAHEALRHAAAGADEAASNLTSVIEQAPTTTVAVQGLQGVAREWVKWVQTRAQNQKEGFASLVRCRTPLEYFSAQARLVQEDLTLWMESGARMYQIASRAIPRSS